MSYAWTAAEAVVAVEADGVDCGEDGAGDEGEVMVILGISSPSSLMCSTARDSLT